MSIMSEIKRMGKHCKNPGHLFKGRPKDPLDGYVADAHFEMIKKRMNTNTLKVGARGRF